VSTEPLLDIRGLTVEFPGRTNWVRAVEDVSLSVGPGQVVGLVGESGSGKTVTSLALLGLTWETGGRIAAGSVIFEGEDLVTMPKARLNDVRGGRVGMIFQQPVRTLDPGFTVGSQIAETIRRHTRASKADAWQRTLELLDRVHIADVTKRAKQYPHEFSGGMCQRVMIAMALSCSPSLLIADEPTTALDVTVQAHVLALLKEIQRDTGIAVLFISHDLGVIANMCDQVAIMYAGQIVEQAPIQDLFLHPTHPYTAGLIAAVPKVGHGRTLRSIEGNVPDPGFYPKGCRFHPRCDFFEPGRCDAAVPDLVETRPGCLTRCVRARELRLDGVPVG
jgi:peptide/nickel transport system ATP-binding protein